MGNLDIFQVRLVKIDEFGWCYLEMISEGACTHFTSTYFQDKYQTRSVCLTLAAPKNQEVNVQVKVTWIMFCTIAHSLMVHALVL